MPRNCSPIALDFGGHSVKALQLEQKGGRLRVRCAHLERVATAPSATPVERRAGRIDAAQRVLRTGSFRGRSAIVALGLAEIEPRRIRIPMDKLPQAGEIITREIQDQQDQSGELRIVPIPVADLDSQQISDIKSYIASSDKEFYWGTPLAPALKAAVDQQRASKMTGTKSIILFTDGIPTSCDTTADPNANELSRIVDAAAAGSKDGIRTFVMGVIDGTKGARATTLSPVAKAGGTARKAGCETDNSCFYALNSNTYAQDIKAAFDDISLKAFDCIFDLPPVQGNATADLSKINVQIDDGSGAVQVSLDTTHADGWDFTPDQTHLQLHGPTCEKVKEKASTKVEIVVGCKTQGK